MLKRSKLFTGARRSGPDTRYVASEQFHVYGVTNFGCAM